jgi:hypothetical protein
MAFRPVLALAFAAGLAPAAATQTAPPSLSFPLACTLGRTCEIQHYVDRDPGPGTRDYRCGPQTYQGHSGIDIRLKDMAAQRRGVSVLTAAPGRVVRLRDGVAERVIGQPGVADVNAQECGNGVVIDHGGGWETQYCHMAKDSIVVKVGQPVVAGTPLGRVGLSGKTEFPHLHLTVRHGSEVVDPFAPDSSDPASCRAQPGLWTAQAKAQMSYHAGQVLNAGFTDRQVSMNDVENGGLPAATAAAPWLIFYVRATGLLAGDAAELELKGPGGAVLAKARQPALRNWRAQDLRLIGKRKPPTGWAPGLYTGDYRVWRQGKVALSQHLEVRL